MKKILLFFLLLCFSNILFGDNIQFLDKNNKSKINWIKGQYISLGESIISGDINKATEEAKNQALVNLVALIEKTVINTDKTGLNYLDDFYLKHKIRVYLANISNIEIQRKNNDKIIVKIVTPIYGKNNIGGILLNKCIKAERALIYNKDEMIFPIIAKVDKFPIVLPIENNTVNYIPIKKNNKNYTGVIFVVNGLKLNPSLCPKIRIENGDVTWTMSKEDVDLALNKGISYNNNLEEAKNNSLVGDNPLVISAVNTCGIYNSDIIIKEEDAKILKSENNISHFLNKLKVIIVNN